MSASHGNKVPSFACSLLAGGVAGITVDVALFPLDTIKTRLQAPSGINTMAGSGLRGLYSGIGAAAVGSAPTSALFFSAYETLKVGLAERTGGTADDPSVHIMSASGGEAVACAVRVPTENVKQKLQVGLYATNAECLSGILAKQGPLGFFRGYLATVAREVPFSAIQFPIYEGLKLQWSSRATGELGPFQAAMCGSVAGAVAGFITCPLDVTKTRMMLTKPGETEAGFVKTMKQIVKSEGAIGLFGGAGPRVVWMSLGEQGNPRPHRYLPSGGHL